MGEAYRRFWNLTFVNDERDSRYQFWTSIMIQTIILIIFLAGFAFLFANRLTLSIVWLFIFLIGFAIILWPTSAAAMRRMNDVGMNSLVFKRVKRIYSILILIGAIIYLSNIFFDFKIIEIEYFNIYMAIVFSSYIIFTLLYCTLPTDKYKHSDQTKKPN